MYDLEVYSVVRKYCDTWNKMLLQYEEYAKRLGMSYSTLQVFCMIYNEKGCTQKQICEHTFLPKQTVSAIVSGFIKQGKVQMTRAEADGRSKVIHLTESGKAYADSVVPNIRIAECAAFEYLNSEEQELLIKLTQKYTEHFSIKLVEVTQDVSSIHE